MHKNTQLIKELIPLAGICTCPLIIFIANMQKRMHLKSQEIEQLSVLRMEISIIILIKCFMQIQV